MSSAALAGAAAFTASAATSGTPVQPAPAASAALLFRPLPADDAPFPVGGAVLLLALLAAALLAAWYGRHGGGLRRVAGRWGMSSSADGRSLEVIDSASLANGARLHVVRWAGGTVLVAVQAGQPPVVLDRLAETPREATGSAP